MEFRATEEADVRGVMNIINEAKEYFKGQGIDQWQNGYPDEKSIKDDIINKHGYVLLEGSHIVGTVAVSFDGENTYDKIYDGKWLTNNSYAVVHRIAVASMLKGKGIASQILDNIEELCIANKVNSIKIDTHKDNMSMQKLLKKNGFKYCGIIYLEDGNERIAFEKTF